MSVLPDSMHSFLEGAGWDDATIEPLPGDASFRRYFRLRRDDGTAMLMHAPPPHEDPQPFLKVARWLSEQGLRTPAILDEDAEQGWVLTEDFGDDRIREWLDEHPQDDALVYGQAVDVLTRLHGCPAGPFDAYDLPTYLREARLFIEWHCPAASLTVDEGAWEAAWQTVLEPLVARQQPAVTVLRDYHAENIMLPPGGGQGLIDFQDALAGHPAYDLVSLLQDARRDVPKETERAMLVRYRAAVPTDDSFEADYAILGAQRNAKIVGIFTRLAKRDGKPRYLDMIPRVWRYLERDLAHPALAPVAAWFDANIPAELRTRHGELAE